MNLKRIHIETKKQGGEVTPRPHSERRQKEGLGITEALPLLQE